MTVRLALAVALLFLLSGCASPSHHTGSTGTTDDSAQEPDQPTVDLAGACKGMQEKVLDWSWDANSNPTGGSGMKGFDVPNGTVQIRIDATTGPFVQADWTLSVKDGSGHVVWSQNAAAKTTAIGQNNNAPGGTFAASAGHHEFSWTIDGYVSSFMVQFTARDCAK
jgi:hypothetical protein